MGNRTAALVTIAGLLLASGAGAALERIEEAFEVALTQVELPLHEAGQLRLTPCAGCERVALPVGSRTRYLIGYDGDGQPLEAFREAAVGVGDPRSALVVVIYDTGTREVTRLILDVPRR
jgi:hypothetical protein